MASYNNTDHASGSADKLRQLGREALELSGGREAGEGEFLSDMGPSGSILVTHQPLSRSIDFVSCRRLGLGMDLSKIASEEIRWSVESCGLAEATCVTYDGACSELLLSTALIPGGESVTEKALGRTAPLWN